MKEQLDLTRQVDSESPFTCNIQGKRYFSGAAAARNSPSSIIPGRGFNRYYALLD
jgi:hypothetical protein